MIPLNFLRKMGVHNLKTCGGINIRVNVVDNEEMVNTGILELRIRLDKAFPVLGIDLKYTQQGDNARYGGLLVLDVEDRCLMVQLSRMSTFPISLASFIADEKICFLGLKISDKLEELRKVMRLKGGTDIYSQYMPKTWVDLGTFAARTLNNRELHGCLNLVELATKAGLPINLLTYQDKSIQCPDWETALCFSTEEVEYALAEAYACYKIGKKLMA